ncbi:ATP-grasp fold amidoligase family protein [Cellulomonas bogoriensis]|uniref:Teichuronopeptide biosynthesis TupA-like protein n=1 Tax=Cellulomonas bogoriensis 69B4 = DSM 16987 TaxID=1386082 RepID=A0A0A0BPS7_9CELL|nr:ATP-grasp fold amidoligase family protein [Cellulomonas bogoriensis]KGM09946.1 hypothetical protein N869_05840 [Cellulomonas bogoriensis 69B4 = DSM 16987]
MLTSLVRRLPPVARRDATIKELRRRLRRAELDAPPTERTRTEGTRTEGTRTEGTRTEQPATAMQSPSFLYKLREAGRIHGHLKRLGGPLPMWELNRKHRGYRFAVSHGVAIPPVIGAYARPADVPWDELPDAFVVKTFHGTASHGVMPVRRDGDRFRDLLSSRHLGVEDIQARLTRLVDKGSVSEELFIEELMTAPQGTGLEVVPDYKLYCFYGTIGMIMVAGRRSRAADGRAFRYFDADGADMGNARPGLALDQSLPAPRHLEALTSTGRLLSGAIRSPFVRVDLYERDEGVVFGEITPAPGGVQVLRPELDASFGELWEDAQARLEREAITAGARTTGYGPEPHDHLWRF